MGSNVKVITIYIWGEYSVEKMYGDNKEDRNIPGQWRIKANDNEIFLRKNIRKSINFEELCCLGGNGHGGWRL